MDKNEAALIVREFEPANLEFPFSTLNSLITPTDSFYVRSHFPVPHINIDSWRLKIDGAVDRPCEFSYSDLLALPSRSVTAVMECAGNNRVFLVPKVEGAQWELGAVGNAEWTGVPLPVLMEKAGISARAVDIVFEGADRGIPDQKPKPVHPIHYTRSLPLRKAASEDVLVVYKMNGQTLTPAHGFPIRLVVPGWYGMASVKWLQRIVATTVPFDGYFQKIDYAYWELRDGIEVRQPITEIELKSQIARPSTMEVWPANTSSVVHGAAWAGENLVAKVEVSVDDGKTWEEATLLAPPKPFSWVLWNYIWMTPNIPGTYSVMTRATDSLGNQQPLKHDISRDTYRISHVLSIPVQIR